MKGEKLLTTLYKQRHFNKTQRNIMSTMILIGLGCCMLGIVMVMAVSHNALSLISYGIGFVCIAVAGVLHRLDRLSQKLVSIVVMAYFYFVYVPVDWFTYNGLTGSTTFISLILIAVAVLILPRRAQKVMLAMYLTVLIGLTMYSIFEAAATGADMHDVGMKGAAYVVTALLLAYSLMFLLRKYEKMYEHFLDSSIKDTLTGVFNRRVLDDVMLMVEAQFCAQKTDYVVVMLDINQFKALNDTHGHSAGDDVLKNFTECIRRSVRSGDYVLRYGGDEFLLLMPGATQEAVAAVYERIEKAVAGNACLRDEYGVTFSRGQAHRSAYESPERLIAAADKNMYAHKHAI